MVRQQLLGSLVRSAPSALPSCSLHRVLGCEVASPAAFQPFFMSAPRLGVTNSCFLRRGRDGAARPQQSQRLVPSPALQTAAKYGSRNLFLSVCFVFLSTLFLF